ncbi:MAG: YwiC-like family protein [Ignavibacteriales bacterium]|nr:YwiC-like family protein [Ignavibacteriales bacterium]
MNIPKPIIPKEHGAWAVLFVPMALGIIVGGRFSFEALCLALSALGVFMSYVPIHTILKEWVGIPQGDEKVRSSTLWGVVYLGLGALFIAPLLYSGYWLLIPVGIIGGLSYVANFFLTRYIAKSILSDLMAVLGLTLSAPSAYYMTIGSVDRTAITLWLFNFLFFGCSVFYVHMKIRASSLKKPELSFTEKLSVGKLNLIYHIVVLVIVSVLVFRHYSPQLIVIAFLPMVVHGIYGTLKLTGRVRFKNLGFILLGQSVLFGVLITVIGL